MKEVTLLATSEYGALLDTLAAVRMDLCQIAESKSMPESAKVERLRFAIVAIDAVAGEVKKLADSISSLKRDSREAAARQRARIAASPSDVVPHSTWERRSRMTSHQNVDGRDSEMEAVLVRS